MVRASLVRDTHIISPGRWHVHVFESYEYMICALLGRDTDFIFHSKESDLFQVAGMLVYLSYMHIWFMPH